MQAPIEESALPDRPLTVQNVPPNPPSFSQQELVDLLDAHFTYQLARADFQKKFGAIMVKVVSGSEVQRNSYEMTLNQHGGLIVTDSTGIPIQRTVIGEGDSHPALQE